MTILYYFVVMVLWVCLYVFVKHFLSIVKEQFASEADGRGIYRRILVLSVTGAFVFGSGATYAMNLIYVAHQVASATGM